MLIEYSDSNVNNENNSGMILEDIFNYRREIIQKYFGMQIDMEIVLKCEYKPITSHDNRFCSVDPWTPNQDFGWW